MVCFCLIVAARYRLRSDFANSTRDPRVILVAISLPPSDQWLNGAMGLPSVAFQMRQHPKSGNNSGEAMREPQACLDISMPHLFGKVTSRSQGPTPKPPTQ